MVVFLLLCHPVTGPGAADPGGVQRPGAPIWTAETEAESIQGRGSGRRIWQPGSVPADLAPDLTGMEAGRHWLPGAYTQAIVIHRSKVNGRQIWQPAREIDGGNGRFSGPRIGQKVGPGIVESGRTNRTRCNHNRKTAKNTKLCRFQIDSNITVISVTTVTKNDDSGKWKLSQPVTETVTTARKPVKNG